MRGRNLWAASRSKGGRAVRTAAVAAWAVAFFLTIGLGGAFAGTRLIAHFENDNNADLWGRDVLWEFYGRPLADPQGGDAAVNLYPQGLLDPSNSRLAPFPPRIPMNSALGGDPFEIHEYDTTGTEIDPARVVPENRFGASGSGWSLGAQNQVADFQINFMSVTGGTEDDDTNYVPGPPGLGQFLANNTVTGTVQDWSAYSDLCFYLCINSADIPPQQFFDNFKVQVWEYWVDVQGPPWVVIHNEREIYELSLTDILAQNTGLDGQPLRPFTGWKHLRVPFSSFQRVDWSNTYWRYANYVSGPPVPDAFDAMDNTANWDHVRAVIFRKQPTGVAGDPADRVTVAIDEITVTGDTTAQVLRVNIPGQIEPIPMGPLSHAGEVRCDDTQDRGLCWAQLFPTPAPDDPDQVRPYRNAVKPATGGTSDPNRNVDVVVTVRDWQQFWATFSADVGNGAVVSSDTAAFSSEIVFVPQFQAPGTWVQRGLPSLGPQFLRRKGTIHIPGPPARESLFCTEWRYDYTNGFLAENYLVHYHPAGAAPFDTPFGRLDPSAQPRGGFLANYLREFGYAYGTLFILPRDFAGNIGRAQVIDVLFEQPTQTPELRYERLTTGRP